MEFGRYYEEPGAQGLGLPGTLAGPHRHQLRAFTLFALVTMNQNPLFIDDEYARSQSLGPTAEVVDTLVFSLTVGMKRTADTTGKAIANLGYESVAFERPLFPGDSLYAESPRFSKNGTPRASPIVASSTLKPVPINQNRERVLVLTQSTTWFRNEVSHESSHCIFRAA